jgi:hypothetical protein
MRLVHWHRIDRVSVHRPDRRVRQHPHGVAHRRCDCPHRRQQLLGGREVSDRGVPHGHCQPAGQRLRNIGQWRQLLQHQRRVDTLG